MATDSEPHNEPGSDPMMGRAGYEILATIGAALGAVLARSALRAGWRTVVGKAPPKHPQSPDVEWIEAVTWAAASAAVVAVARVATQRRVLATWRRASGTRGPEEVELP
jgi:hypothetical protein